MAVLLPVTDLEPAKRRCRRPRSAFTLLELLVVIALIGVLLTLLAPALSNTMGSARGFRCQMTLRQVAFDFSLFADEQFHGDRGDDARLSGRRFRLMTFQESLYGLDEYWDNPEADTNILYEKAADPPMRCTEVHGDLTLRRGFSAEEWGAIAPPQSVSFGFNIRLHRPEVGNYPIPVDEPVRLSNDIMQHGMTPLVWDVDGEEAFHDKNWIPQFTGPSVQDRGFYANEMVWFPGTRHNGTMNIAFIGGQVVSTKEPLRESNWRWDYQPVR